MFGFSIRTGRQNASGSPKSTGSPSSVGSPKTAGSTGSPRAEVGEIDTRAPFQSVRAAVSLFGEAGSSPKAKPTIKRSKTIEERVLEKESRLHLALRELDSFKEQIRSTETTKAHALRELEKAKRTLQELTGKLETLCESKQAAIEATEAAKARAIELEEQKSNKPPIGTDAWKQNVEAEREQYRTSSGELNSAKQELTNLRQDFDAALEAKLAAFQEAADAQHNAAINKERLGKLSKEVDTLRETLGQVKVASLQAQDEHEKLIADKEAHFHSLSTAKEEAEDKIRALKEDPDSQLVTENLLEKLEVTNEAIHVLQDQLNEVRALDLDSFNKANAELDATKKALNEIAEEESSLRTLVDSLQLEVERVKGDLSNLKKKAEEAESVVENLKMDLENSKKELEASISAKTQAEGDSNDLPSRIQQLNSEADQFLKEAEEMKKKAELLKQETKTAQETAKETEERLKVALKEAEEAKAAKKLADDKIHNNNEEHNLESNGKIRLSIEQFDEMKRKVEITKNDAEIKVKTALAQVESINANENEANKKLEAILKEKEDIEAATQEALKTAEMAEAAKLVVEGELQKWRQKEQEEEEIGESSNGNIEGT
ncbi:WEB family protein At5g55860-like [Nicotiana tabacum]|uniref:WEB family protein At1g12150-like n=1 Tax=Nicotiana tabacum TaxID=4097 RepID=A0A1S4A6C8_TOBAC|nr:WEB family protein At1g12150-like [Nicotiana tomentosiformis]XP_016472121.1 PREDICTED: WEB family protein At1g12150-like [Nicotiana tabacum]XP_033508550.1 WEB family protein At1g12150-like [Nicotiana tomentosiformis]